MWRHPPQLRGGWPDPARAMGRGRLRHWDALHLRTAASLLPVAWCSTRLLPRARRRPCLQFLNRPWPRLRRPLLRPGAPRANTTTTTTPLTLPPHERPRKEERWRWRRPGSGRVRRQGRAGSGPDGPRSGRQLFLFVTIAFLYRSGTADTLNWLFLVSSKGYRLEEPTYKMVYQPILKTIFVLVKESSLSCRHNVRFLFRCLID
jgi:hypothetical protein